VLPESLLCCLIFSDGHCLKLHADGEIIDWGEVSQLDKDRGESTVWQTG
jgi:hypothetical protein